MPRNPAWTRDELILALELYYRVNPSHTSQTNPEIIALSRTLNELPIHGDRPDAQHFRNPNGIYMKLCNFLRFDPTYSGSGLQRGSKLEEDVWDEFASNRGKLTRTAAAIKGTMGSITPEEVVSELSTDEPEFAEGRLLTALHKRRERSPALTRRKKEAALAVRGALECEACGFDFAQVYGDLGEGYAECHHLVPLAGLADSRPTRLADLAIVCANCHRMIHRSRPMLTVEQLSRIVTSEVVDI